MHYPVLLVVRRLHHLCNMDIKVGLSIFNKPWLIERNAALACLNVFFSLKKGEKFEYGNSKPRSSRSVFGNDVVIAPIHRADEKNFSGYAGARIAVIAVSGPLMKEDYCGWYGTAALLNEFRKAEASDSIQGIILLIDSPGGTVDGTQVFADAVKKSRKGTLALVDELACSAAYWIACSCDEVWTTSDTAQVGSIGTYISWYDDTEYLKSNGIVLREYYATKSNDKNRAFREANSDSEGAGKLLIEEILDPTNDVFLKAVQRNRADKINGDDVLTGKVYLSQLAKKNGLIDRIGSFEQAIDRTLNLSKNKNALSMSNNKKFAALCAVLGWQNGFEATKQGVYLQESEMEAADTALATNANRITQLETDLTQANSRAEEAVTGRQAAETKIVSQQEEIEQLNAKITKLEGSDNGKFTTAQSDKNDTIEQKDAPSKFETSADRELKKITG